MRILRLAAWMALIHAGTALATTALYADLPALSRRADLVVRAEVQSLQSRWSADGLRIVTDVTLKVAEPLKGEAPEEVVVRQPGGVVGNIGQRVDGLANFSPGEEVVVFLVAQPDRSFRVAGLAQGKLRIERTSDGRAAFAVPDAAAHLSLLDPLTREPRSARAEALTLEELRQVVSRSSAPALPPAPKAPKGTR